MAKLTRQILKLFGRDGSSDKFNQFGSRATGTAVPTKDIATIQGLDAWLNGVHQAILSGSKAPFLQDFNGLFYVLGYQAAYLLQEGIPEWQTGTSYYIGSVVKKTGTFELYGSLTDDNLGNSLPSQVNSAHWKYLGELGNFSNQEPVGVIKEYAGSSAPSGYLECNGAAVSRVTYSTLFGVIGVTYGAGDGVTTFNLPDLRGVFVRGWDHGRGVDTSRAFGSYQDDQFQSHFHANQKDGTIGNLTHGAGNPNTDGIAGNINETNPALTAIRQPITDGANGTPRTGSETRPKNVALLYIIKH